jgi:hypothetical protein
MKTHYWESGSPLAARYALRRIMAEGNAKVPIIQNYYFPEVRVTTNLEEIIRDILQKKEFI